MKKAEQAFLFGNGKMPITDAIGLTIASLNEYGGRHKHWAMAWSGGKDSTTVLTVVLQLLAAGLIAPPESLTVCYADTRMEIVPLWLSAQAIIKKLRSLGINVVVAVAPMDKRFLVYMLGRGVPPPSNTFRWCTGHIKVEPMEAALLSIFQKTGEKILTITGVRQGESAVRDGRISQSCSKDGAECGQGWYQTGLKNDITSTLAPIIHWRLCLVWDWLKVYAPSKRTDLFDEYPGLSGGGWDTSILADAYGGEDAEEINARTGCMGCPLASKDLALTAVCKMPKWSYLAPLLNLKPLYREMKMAKYRLRKPGGEKRKDGTLSKNQQRMGPLTIEARRHFFLQLTRIQSEVNTKADLAGMPRVDFLNDDECARILQLQKLNTWPDGWDGTEPIANVLHHRKYADGSVMENLFAEY
ncbi:phosphoadenosine phosphosulfate reductase family protein [Spirosoma sp. BT702]|uniref:Phosphoadenosine phosphosulfate reductase family protein n=1 Tax=Spirosoma profusum TaxID=2771354 RepID=A0A926XTM9_9BACT|nr:phosphoadenosine phosphosulfate reductase family protein [Spirosoma profusum]MBD2700118.1 phosphoadenosine phosphosulfate reductase family protein [Spirosoma profusum]